MSTGWSPRRITGAARQARRRCSLSAQERPRRQALRALQTRPGPRSVAGGEADTGWTGRWCSAVRFRRAPGGCRRSSARPARRNRAAAIRGGGTVRCRRPGGPWPRRGRGHRTLLPGVDATHEVLPWSTRWWGVIVVIEAVESQFVPRATRRESSSQNFSSASNGLRWWKSALPARSWGPGRARPRPRRRAGSPAGFRATSCNTSSRLRSAIAREPRLAVAEYRVVVQEQTGDHRVPGMLALDVTAGGAGRAARRRG